jgi:hypothetical protein
LHSKRKENSVEACLSDDPFLATFGYPARAQWSKLNSTSSSSPVNAGVLSGLSGVAPYPLPAAAELPLTLRPAAENDMRENMFSSPGEPCPCP